MEEIKKCNGIVAEPHDYFDLGFNISPLEDNNYKLTRRGMCAILHRTVVFNPTTPKMLDDLFKNYIKRGEPVNCGCDERK